MNDNNNSVSRSKQRFRYNNIYSVLPVNDNIYKCGAYASCRKTSDAAVVSVGISYLLPHLVIGISPFFVFPFRRHSLCYIII